MYSRSPLRRHFISVPLVKMPKKGSRNHNTGNMRSIRAHMENEAALGARTNPNREVPQSPPTLYTGMPNATVFRRNSVLQKVHTPPTHAQDRKPVKGVTYSGFVPDMDDPVTSRPKHVHTEDVELACGCVASLFSRVNQLESAEQRRYDNNLQFVEQNLKLHQTQQTLEITLRVVGTLSKLLEKKDEQDVLRKEHKILYEEEKALRKTLKGQMDALKAATEKTERKG